MNKSGIIPQGDRVLLKPDQIEETTAGGIVIPASERDKHQMAQVTGVVVDIGSDAWIHTTTQRYMDGKWVPFERVGYSKPWCKVGDRVTFARHVGLPTVGEDGEEYRLVSDEDILSTVSEKVDLTQFRKRERIA